MKKENNSIKMSGKKTKPAIASLAVLLCLIIIIVLVVSTSRTEEVEVTYREVAVQYGSLVVGVTESGAVDIGVVEQTFDLDMSALQRATISNTGSSGTGGSSGNAGMGNAGAGGFSGGMGAGNSATSMSGGLSMFDQIFNMAGGSSFSQSNASSSLTIEEVLVSIGQQVAEGDAIIRLEEESVTELTEELQSNIEKAKADLDAVYADQVLSKQTAEYTYQTSLCYGDYAQAEYEATVAELEQDVADKQDALEEARGLLEDYKQQLAEAETLYANALIALEHCEWSRDNEDKWDSTYQYVTYYQEAREAQSMVDTLEQKKERLEQNVEQAENNIVTAEKSLNAAKRSLEQGKLTAQQTYDLRLLAYDTAQETYDIAISYLADDAVEQEETYAETLEKWEEYSSHIDGTEIRSQYNGVITSVDLTAGDSITTGTVLVTLYDMEAVTMTVTLYEEDIVNVALDSPASITFIAYPDAPFRARVTEISEASTDSSGNVTYDVTVTLQGDVSGLFQGMTGDITFIEQETADVLYVSERAIYTEGDYSYVKIYDDNGNVKQVQVTTGFSDGTYVEIVEGLQEGDIVLIERKVAEE